jgi:hypothetical protein
MTAVHQIKSAQQIFCSNPSWAKAAHEHLNAISHPSFTSHVSPHPISQPAAATHPPKQHCSCFSTEPTRMQDGNLEARREGLGLFPATERAGEVVPPFCWCVRVSKDSGRQRLLLPAPSIVGVCARSIGNTCLFPPCSCRRVIAAISCLEFAC